jgi:hypothetical protein
MTVLNNNDPHAGDRSQSQRSGLGYDGQAVGAASGIENISTVMPQGMPAALLKNNHQSSVASDILQDIRSQLVNQSGFAQSRSGSGPSSRIVGSPASAPNAAVQNEIMLLKEQHELDRLELERKLGEASRAAERHRRRAERLLEEQRLNADASSAIRESNRHLNVSADVHSGSAPPSSASTHPADGSLIQSSFAQRMPPPPPVSSVRSSSPQQQQQHQAGGGALQALQQQFASPLSVKAGGDPGLISSGGQRPWRP